MKNRTNIKKRVPNIVKELNGKLQEDFRAHLASLVLKQLSSKGYDFDTETDMHMFFKERVKLHSHDGINTYLLDSSIPLCAYKEPTFKQIGNEVSTVFEFIPL